MKQVNVQIITVDLAVRTKSDNIIEVADTVSGLLHKLATTFPEAKVDNLRTEIGVDFRE